MRHLERVQLLQPRALLLERLYSTPELSALFSIADFAYSTPSTLLLERTEATPCSRATGSVRATRCPPCCSVST